MADNEGSRKKKRSALTDPDPAIPDKLYFRIGEVARLLSIAPYVLRFWESEFPQLHPNKGGTGQRLYRRRDVEMALRIKRLLYQQGYTIPGARQMLKSEAREPDHAPAPPTAEIPVESAQARLRRVRSELKEIASLLESQATVRQSGSVRSSQPLARRGLQVTPGGRKPQPRETPVLLFPDHDSAD